MEHDLPLGQQHDVVKKVISFWGRLQQSHQQRGIHDVAEVGKALGDEEGGGTVQTCADLIHEQHLLAAHNYLTCTATTAELHCFAVVAPLEVGGREVEAGVCVGRGGGRCLEGGAWGGAGDKYNVEG